jgi:glycerophosphoryl diester phosphodiesterase
LRETLISYLEALRLWRPFFAVHIFVRLATAAILVPVIGILLAATLRFSDQSALTDQDIARFLFTPAGAVGGLAVLSLVIVSAVVDVSAMAAILLQRVKEPVRALRTIATCAPRALSRLTRFALALLLRVLLIAAPFVAVAGLTAQTLLTDYDINYYLTDRPPEFIYAAVVIGFAGLGLAIVLAHRLSGWALALHFAVFDAVPVSKAFRESRRHMEGHRANLIMKVAIWLAARLAVGSALFLLMGIVAAKLPTFFGSRLAAIAGVLIAVGAAWAALNAFVNAMANGALADILSDEFIRSLGGRSPRIPPLIAAGNAARTGVAIGIVVLLSIGTLGAGGLALGLIKSSGDVQIIGHRGAAASRPENTMASVVKAIEDGADWVEIDVQETADGEIVVAHDSDFMKSAGTPLKVWEATMDDIADIDIGSWFDPTYKGERAPLLRDVLAAAKDHSKVIIELKYYGHDVDLENRVIALVEEAGMEHRIATMSLHYPAVEKMRLRRPDWRAGVLAATAVGDLAGLEGDFLAVNTGLVSSGLVARADDAGKDVYAWTVNEPLAIARMLSLGVDGLITDDPALAREVASRYSELSTPERIALILADRLGLVFDLDAPDELRP